MKQKDIARLRKLLALADHLKHIGETHPAETILIHIAHTISEAFERKPNGESSSSTSV